MALLKDLGYRFLVEDEGTTLVEYVLLVALIAVVAIAAMRYLGSVAANSLNNVSNNVANGS